MFHTPKPFSGQEPFSLAIFDSSDADCDETLKWLDDYLDLPLEGHPPDAWALLPPPPPPPVPLTRGVPAGNDPLPLVGPLLDFSSALRLRPIDEPGCTATAPGEPAAPDFGNMSLAQLKAWFVEHDSFIGLRYPDARREYYELEGKTRPVGKNKRKDAKLTRAIKKILRKHNLSVRQRSGGRPR